MAYSRPLRASTYQRPRVLAGVGRCHRQGSRPRRRGARVSGHTGAGAAGERETGGDQTGRNGVHMSSYLRRRSRKQREGAEATEATESTKKRRNGKTESSARPPRQEGRTYNVCRARRGCRDNGRDAMSSERSPISQSTQQGSGVLSTFSRPPQTSSYAPREKQMHLDGSARHGDASGSDEARRRHPDCRRVGASGRVTGVDVSTSMIEEARRRADARGLAVDLKLATRRRCASTPARSTGCARTHD